MRFSIKTTFAIRGYDWWLNVSVVLQYEWNKFSWLICFWRMVKVKECKSSAKKTCIRNLLYYYTIKFILILLLMNSFVIYRYIINRIFFVRFIFFNIVLRIFHEELSIHFETSAKQLNFTKKKFLFLWLLKFKYYYIIYSNWCLFCLSNKLFRQLFPLYY